MTPPSAAPNDDHGSRIYCQLAELVQWAAAAAVAQRLARRELQTSERAES